jgi:hypothetical protein
MNINMNMMETKHEIILLQDEILRLKTENTNLKATIDNLEALIQIYCKTYNKNETTNSDLSTSTKTQYIYDMSKDNIVDKLNSYKIE